MALKKLEQDLAVIQKLDDLPNDVGGLTAAQLKAKFDEGVLAVQRFLNETLIPDLIAGKLPFLPTEKIPWDNIQDAVVGVQKQIADAAAALIVDGSVTKEKLSEALLQRIYGGRPWVSMDVPTAGDDPAAGFPVGQVWLRAGYTVKNLRSSLWSASGCTVAQDGEVWTLTGSGASASVSAIQNLTGIGTEGQKVYVCLSITSRDSGLSSLVIRLNGAEQSLNSGGVFETALGAGGSLMIELAAEWPAASLASGAVVFENFAVVNAGEAEASVPQAQPVRDWPALLKTLLPLTETALPDQVYIQTGAGVWLQTGYDVLPVFRGGTGLSQVRDGQLVYGSGGKLHVLEIPEEEGSLLRFSGGAPAWVREEDLVSDVGILRCVTGSYVGTGKSGSITLPVTPKLLSIRSETGPWSANSLYSAEGVYVDQPLTLANGAKRRELLWGRNADEEYDAEYVSYTSTVELAGDRLTFHAESYYEVTAETLLAEAYNREGRTYHWTAVY